MSNNSHSDLNNSNLQFTFAFLHLDIKEEAGHVIKMAGKTDRRVKGESQLGY